MNKIELVNKINNYVFSGEDTELLDELNELFDTGEYKVHLNLVFNIISITQMYGFLAYLNDEEKTCFSKLDTLRSQSYSGKKMDYYNSGQLSLLFELDTYKKVFFSAPTSFGKTSLIIEYIISNFRQFKNVLFIVPTNSLLEELYVKVINLNAQYDMGYYVSTQPYIQEARNSFLIITPERFLILNEEIEVHQFDLIVMDETYKIVDSRNEKISDFIEARAFRFRKVADIIGNTPNHLILLSPFTYLLTESMNNYLTKHNIKKLDRKIEYVKRELYKIESSSDFRNRFKIKVVGYGKQASMAQKVNLLLRVLQDEKNIVYVPQYAKAYDIVDQLDWTRKVAVTERYLKFLEHLQKNYTVDDKYEWKIISALKKGIGIYISPLPRYIKREIVNLYEANVLGTLIVTTAFTEGVNTNASNLIFTSLINGPTSNSLSDIDVLNVSGRAGRFAKNSIGKVYCTSEVVYNKVFQLQEEAEVKLENHNYCNNSSAPRNDYEIDMIEEQYLSDDEKEIKDNLRNEVEELGLTYRDLNISLNVSIKWKIALYRYFMNNYSEVQKAYTAAVELLSQQPNKRIESLDIIFKMLKKSFACAGIEGFLCAPYEIRAFDSKGEFVWGRLYKVYCAGSISKVISNNMIFIVNRFEEIIKKNNLSMCTDKIQVEEYFKNEGMSWILRYYKKNLTLNFDAFYSETFKFISSIVQYKIPFYTSYFVSVLKLFMLKNDQNMKYNTSKLDAKKITLLFEDGSIYDDYSKLIDYGISNDLIIKLHDKEITLERLKARDFMEKDFDEYELLLLEEFLRIV